MSIYREENIITTLTGAKCERMYDHPEGKTWRIILGEEDYDYIEDGYTLAMLEKELVELEMDKFSKNSDYVVPTEVEDSIADEAGLLRNWDHVIEAYTETQLKWLERLHDYYNQIDNYNTEI